MGRQDRDQRQLFYEFSLDDVIPTDHLLRRVNLFATAVLTDLYKSAKGVLQRDRPAFCRSRADDPDAPCCYGIPYRLRRQRQRPF
jgi:hypothetical protein